jgi:hypothetical protein
MKRENQTPLPPFICVGEKRYFLQSRIAASGGGKAQFRSGRGTEKDNNDWMADRVRFELTVLFATDSAFLPRNSRYIHMKPTGEHNQ